MPPDRDVEAGYPISSVVLGKHIPEDVLEKRCKELWGDLQAWRLPRENGRRPNTIGWVIWHYRNDIISPFHKKRHRTRRSYDYLCNTLEVEIGHRTISRITGEDVLKFYSGWEIKSGPSAAKHLLTMLRTIATYGVIKSVSGATAFKTMLSAMEFPTQPPRQVAPAWELVDAIGKQAVKDGYLSVAITTYAQFEFNERRCAIMGSIEDGVWIPGWEWQHIKNGCIKYYQTKSGLVLREYDLRETPHIVELLEKIPESERWGPVIKCERRRRGDRKGPWGERHYAEVFRQICRRAGVGDEVKSMDMRAGGATEADGVEGVTDRDLQDSLGHSNPRTKDRYRRDKPRNAQKVVRLRQLARKAAK